MAFSPIDVIVHFNERIDRPFRPSDARGRRTLKSTLTLCVVPDATFESFKLQCGNQLLTHGIDIDDGVDLVIRDWPEAAAPAGAIVHEDAVLSPAVWREALQQVRNSRRPLGVEALNTAKPYLAIGTYFAFVAWIAAVAWQAAAHNKFGGGTFNTTRGHTTTANGALVCPLGTCLFSNMTIDWIFGFMCYYTMWMSWSVGVAIVFRLTLNRWSNQVAELLWPRAFGQPDANGPWRVFSNGIMTSTARLYAYMLLTIVAEGALTVMAATGGGNMMVIGACLVPLLGPAAIEVGHNLFGGVRHCCCNRG